MLRPEALVPLLHCKASKILPSFKIERVVFKGNIYVLTG